eukprot:15295031-Alexandrium_andersonii.AAC.1
MADAGLEPSSRLMLRQLRAPVRQSPPEKRKREREREPACDSVVSESEGPRVGGGARRRKR